MCVSRLSCALESCFLGVFWFKGSRVQELFMLLPNRPGELLGVPLSAWDSLQLGRRGKRHLWEVSGLKNEIPRRAETTSRIRKTHHELHNIQTCQTYRRVTNRIPRQGTENDHICFLGSRPVSEEDRQPVVQPCNRNASCS